MKRHILVALAGIALLAGIGSPSPAAAASEPGWIIVHVTRKTEWGTDELKPANVRVTFVEVTTGQRYAASTDNYSNHFAAVPNGVYQVSAYQDSGTGPRSATTWWPGVYSEAAAGTFRIDNTIRGGDCNVMAPSMAGCVGAYWDVILQTHRTLSGATRNRAGQPVGKHPVTAIRKDESATRFSTTTDTSGRFSLSLPPGVWHLESPNGNTTAETPNVAVFAPSQSADVVLKDVPSAPREVSAVASSRKLTVTWTPPADTGGADMTGYTATASPGGQSCSTNEKGDSCDISGLTNNRAYTVTVKATNKVGTGPASPPTAPVTPNDPAPDSPMAVVATPGNRSAIVSWAPPRIGGDTVLGYRVQSNPGGFSCTTADLSCEITGLTNGVSYVFQVTATSTGGESALSAASSVITPAGIPSAPRNVQADPGDQTVYVSWNTPDDDGGAPITGYTATVWPTGKTCTTTGTDRDCAIGGLFNQQSYSVSVTATNRVGTSERSPGSIQVKPNASLPDLRTTATRVELKKLKATKGKVVVGWTAFGVQKTVLSWKQMPKGKTHKRTTGAAGRMTLKGKKGTLFQVGLVGVNVAGERTTTQRVFRIR